jgi:cytochrome c-type biogenesis protein CcmF
LDIGYSAIAVALVAAIISIGAFIFYIRRNEESIYNFSRVALIVQTLMLTFSIIILLYYFLVRDFNVEYVALYSDRGQSLEYTIGALWGGASGSLLLWAWILSVFMMAIILRERKDKLTGYSLMIMLSINIFFLLVIAIFNNPFERLSFTPQDGQGLNPLLVNPGMLIHPPTLFIGYAGLAIPFAFALAGLLSETELWIFRVRKWALFAWLFIGVGIFLGGWWSYVVLGWGGYWAWDPVENSSLVPWLFASALIHSVMLQESRRGMKLWNILLSIGAFTSVILATFLTRSGLISSVHAFGESEIGPIFSTYLGLVLAASLIILAFKFDQVKSMNIFQSATGREASFLFNNLFFVVMALTIIWGTLFPMINEAVTGSKLSVGPGFYNAIAPWVILALAFLMGFCIILRWGTTGKDELIQKLRFPVIISVISIPITYFLGFFDIGSLIGVSISVFAVVLHIEDYIFDVREYSTRKRIGKLSSMFKVILSRRRRYGGYIVHISMIFIFLGLIGTTIYQTSYTSTLQKDMPETLGDYTFTYKGVTAAQEYYGVDYVIDLQVSQGNFRDNVEPMLTDNQKAQSTIVHVGVLSLPFEDIYIIPESVDDEFVAVTINYTPLISFLWIGGPIMFIGVIVGLLPKRIGE